MKPPPAKTGTPFGPITLTLALLLGGCGTPPDSTELTREIVLQHVGGDVGTAGPFSKKGLKELDTLSPKDRAEAVSLFDRDAAAFVVFFPDHSTRIIFVQRGKVVGDFRAAPAPADAPPAPRPPGT